jgi:hypothetical protein
MCVSSLGEKKVHYPLRARTFFFSNRHFIVVIGCSCHSLRRPWPSQASGVTTRIAYALCTGQANVEIRPTMTAPSFVPVVAVDGLFVPMSTQKLASITRTISRVPSTISVATTWTFV